MAALGAPAGASAEGVCPNESLRGELHSLGLPDCRAYEMVTPVFKGGGLPKRLKAISADGSHMIEEVFGEFAGGEGWSSAGTSLRGPAYEFSRTSSGWVASPLDPPAFRFPGAQFFAASRDLTRTLWMLREPSQPVQDADLYVREADGRFVKLGTLIEASGPPGGPSAAVGLEPEPRFAGASADLSHVIMSPEGQGNGGPTRPEVLYEYSLGVAEPQLLGVDDEGRPIGSCGVGLGAGLPSVSGSGGAYNAVSASGETVFFTAFCGVGTPNELYARLGGSETVDVSEPSSVQCEECQTGHSKTPVVEMPAVFVGASEDGSKVFFTTEQELLKGQTTQNLYELDFDRGAGHRILLVSKGSPEPAVQGAARVSEDGSHVYFVAGGVLAGNENRGGEKAEAGKENLYVYERDGAYPQGRVRFIAANTGIEAGGLDDRRRVHATPDGRFLAFQEGEQVFEYDAKEGLLVNVSMGRPGELLQQIYTSLVAAGEASVTVAQTSSDISSDGSAVVFSGEGGAFEYRSVGSIANGALYPLGGGVAPSRGTSPRIDVSGADVFFTSADALVPWDTNGGEDVYDARVNGGFAEPPPPVGCEGDACQGAQSPGVSFASPGSSLAAAGGNLTPPAQTRPPGESMPRSLTQAQKLARALRACGRRPARKRAACKARARKRYGSTSHARKSDRRGK